jgi:hypothetical protein
VTLAILLHTLVILLVTLAIEAPVEFRDVVRESDVDLYRFLIPVAVRTIGSQVLKRNEEAHVADGSLYIYIYIYIQTHTHITNTHTHITQTCDY